MKKHLDQTQSHVSAFPRIGEMTRGYGVGTMGKGVALHLEIEAERQHRFVHEIDGLHYAGWLVLLNRHGCQFTAPFWYNKVFSFGEISHILLNCQHFTPCSNNVPFLFKNSGLTPPCRDTSIYKTVRSNRSDTSQALCPAGEKYRWKKKIGCQKHFCFSTTTKTRLSHRAWDINQDIQPDYQFKAAFGHWLDLFMGTKGWAADFKPRTRRWKRMAHPAQH